MDFMYLYLLGVILNFVSLIIYLLRSGDDDRVSGGEVVVAIVFLSILSWSVWIFVILYFIFRRRIL